MGVPNYPEDFAIQLTELRQLAQAAFTAANSDKILVGKIEMFGGPASNVPDGWLVCDGSAVSRTTYADLFGQIGTRWGNGDGSTTFNVPDLTDRVLIGSEGALSVGDTGGSSSTSTDGSHDHSGNTAFGGGHDHSASTGNAGGHSHPNPSTNSGGSHSHSQGSTGSASSGQTHEGGGAASGSPAAHTHSNPNTNSGGSHSHSQSSTGSEPSHDHSIDASGTSHQHGVFFGDSDHSHTHTPPYAAVLAIIRY